MGALASWNPVGLSRPEMGLFYLYLKLEDVNRTCPQNVVWYISLNKMEKVQIPTSSNVTHYLQNPIDWNIVTCS
jgi:hypothetical protein